MKRYLNIALLFSFILTNLAPVTGIGIHKMASTIFLVLCLVHTIIYRKKLNGKRVALVFINITAFISGLFGLILDHIPFIAALHVVISILCVFFLAIHILHFKKL